MTAGVGNTTMIASNDDMRHYYSVFSLCIQFLLPFTGMSEDSMKKYRCQHVMSPSHAVTGIRGIPVDKSLKLCLGGP